MARLAEVGVCGPDDVDRAQSRIIEPPLVR